MDHQIEQQGPFKIIGLAVRTTNRGGQAMQDIGKLWGDFFSRRISDHVPGKISDEIVNLYTEYEGDHDAYYLAVLGHKVASLEHIPEDMIGREIEGAKYAVFTAEGKLPDAIVSTWSAIHTADIDRSYKADFDVYGKEARDPENACVKIYVSIR